MNRYLLFLLLLSVGCTNKQPACQLMTGLGDKDTLLWMCKSKGNELNRFIWKDPYGNIEYEDGTKVRIDYLNGYIFRRGKKVYYKDIYQVSKPRFLLNTSNEYEANIKDSLLLFDMNASIGDTLTESYFFMVNGNLIIKKQIKIAIK